MGRSTARIAGHFGEWMQGRLGPGGPLTLLTVACPALGVRAERLGDGPLNLKAEAEAIPAAQAAHLLRLLDAAPGAFRLSADMPPGGGAGASTAALLALAAVAAPPHDADALARICLAVEGATDPLMLPAPDTVLWAPREARQVRALPPPAPARIVGGFWGAPQRTDPADTRFPDIADLVTAWQDAPGLPDQARLASLSAERCAALRGPLEDPTPSLATSLGALGHVRAHTGSARGLVFAPGAVPAGAEDALRAAGFAHVLTFDTGHPR
jgi:uncharacterized protein involved in propanediol utilization